MVASMSCFIYKRVDRDNFKGYVGYVLEFPSVKVLLKENGTQLKLSMINKISGEVSYISSGKNNTIFLRLNNYKNE